MLKGTEEELPKRGRLKIGCGLLMLTCTSAGFATTDRADEYAAAYRRVFSSVVVIEAFALKVRYPEGKLAMVTEPSKTGTGVVVGPGEVVTNCHVISKAAEIRVTHGDNEYRASVKYHDSDRDLCQLDVDNLDAPAIKIGSSRDIQVGEPVFTVGTPQGLALTLSTGVVSSIRDLDGEHWIQTTAPISPGSSGGGLFNLDAELIGITTFQHVGGQNLNFAAPIEWLNELPDRSAAQVERDEISDKELMALAPRIFSFRREGDGPGLETVARRYIELAPSSTAGWEYLGEAYRYQGKYRESILAYEEALHIDQKEESVWIGLGETYLQRAQVAVLQKLTDLADRDLEEAISCFEAVLGLEPFNPEAMLKLGIAHHFARAPNVSLGYLHRVTEYEDYAGRAWREIAEIYNEKAEPEKAIEAYRKAMQAGLSEDSYTVLSFGIVAADLGLSAEVFKANCLLNRLDGKLGEEFEQRYRAILMNACPEAPQEALEILQQRPDTLPQFINTFCYDPDALPAHCR